MLEFFLGWFAGIATVVVFVLVASRMVRTNQEPQQPLQQEPQEPKKKAHRTMWG